ncbi:lysophospholipid acyltransferase family protein [Arcobacter sp. CECT 8985]|uniref:lysophospholipid acyltransferase family protein n=1 Tax=Arcobacter sp. CECT 8985 TaxID=1935424 RepID=UPI00100B4B70|nr:lysophospholipid acyltransferase family protein [Arcobacter sp. CECT 8985]RXJ84818.1 lipid A biosynthesis acyltransferase [Arcobacter sp. CECT 8985]
MQTKQRVGGFVVKTLYRFYKIFGYKSVYFSLYFVVLYYFLFATNVRTALKDYYKNIGIKFTNRKFFKHLFNYALTTSDRFISKANPEDYIFSNNNRDILYNEAKNGSIIISNHFGGWATATNYFDKDNVKINVVMNEAMIKNAKEFESIISKKNEKCVKIIDISKGMIATSITIGNALLNNESVAFMGDRALNKKYEIKTNFFGKEASFNKNPFLIAYKTKKPIILLFVVLKKSRTYELLYERIDLDYSKKQEESINMGIEKYARKLEEVLKQHPLLWFNFYKFWESK